MTWFISPLGGSTSVTEGGSLTFQIWRNHYGAETVQVNTFQGVYGWNNLGDYSVSGQGGAQTYSYYDVNARFITVNATLDGIADGAEWFQVAVKAANYSFISGYHAAVAFEIRDPVVVTPPTLSVSNAQESEGNSLVFTVSLKPGEVADRDITVRYHTAPVTASQLGGDYYHTADGHGTTVIRAGTSSAKISVATFKNGDAVASETMQLVLDSKSYGGWGTTTGTGTIYNADSGVVDRTPPTLYGSPPQDNATSLAVNANLILNFAEPIKKGTGNIYIYAADGANPGGSLARTISVASNQVSISADGKSVTIDPGANLSAGTSYHVQMGAGVIKDTAGNDFAGIANRTTLNFATATAAQPPSTETAADLFAKNHGKFATLAMFSAAAYAEGSEHRTTLEAQHWKPLQASFPGGTAVLNDGVYTNANAAAYVAKSPDGKSLVVSFRGTDFPKSLNDDKRDILDWGNPKHHYSLFKPLLDAIQALPGEFSNVFVTGHSLGASMAQAFLDDHQADQEYEAVVFASPGTPHVTDWRGSRVTKFVNEDDPIALAAVAGVTVKTLMTYLKSQPGLAGILGEIGNTLVPAPYFNPLSGDQNKILFNDGFDEPSRNTSSQHSMDLYLGVMRFLAAEKVQDHLFVSGGYNKVIVGSQTTQIGPMSTIDGPTIDGNSIAIGVSRYFNLGRGVDHLYGSFRADILAGGAQGDTLAGYGGADALYGGSGNDILDGGAANDVLRGGSGRDIMVGGANSDSFVFRLVTETGKTSATWDIIKDFTHSSDLLLSDRVDLSAIDANGAASGHTFLWLGAIAFTGTAGQLHFRQELGVRTIIEGDTNGDRIADFQIGLTGLKALVATDFIL